MCCEGRHQTDQACLLAIVLLTRYVICITVRMMGNANHSRTYPNVKGVSGQTLAGPQQNSNAFAGHVHVSSDANYSIDTLKNGA